MIFTSKETKCQAKFLNFYNFFFNNMGGEGYLSSPLKTNLEVKLEILI